MTSAACDNPRDGQDPCNVAVVVGGGIACAMSSLPSSLSIVIEIINIPLSMRSMTTYINVNVGCTTPSPHLLLIAWIDHHTVVFFPLPMRSVIIAPSLSPLVAASSHADPKSTGLDVFVPPPPLIDCRFYPPQLNVHRRRRQLLSRSLRRNGSWC